MDQLDKEILSLLSQNARISIKDIAAQVNLTSPAVSARIRHMEENQVIDGYTVVLHPQDVGSRVDCIISIAIKPNTTEDFMQFLASTAEVQQCYHVTGSFSHIIKVTCKDIPQLEHLISRLQHFGSTNSQIILSAPVLRPGV